MSLFSGIMPESGLATFIHGETQSSEIHRFRLAPEDNSY